MLFSLSKEDILSLCILTLNFLWKLFFGFIDGYALEVLMNDRNTHVMVHLISNTFLEVKQSDQTSKVVLCNILVL